MLINRIKMIYRKNILFTSFLFSCLFILACGNPEATDGKIPEDMSLEDYNKQIQKEQDENWPDHIPRKGEIFDGTYTAFIKYYNAGTNNTQKFDAEVICEDNKITRIFFPKNSWHRDAVISAKEVPSDGKLTVIDQKNREYEIVVKWWTKKKEN